MGPLRKSLAACLLDGAERIYAGIDGIADTMTTQPTRLIVTDGVLARPLLSPSTC